MPENTYEEELESEFTENPSEAVEELMDERSEIEILQDELQKEKDQNLRLFAEFDNYKKRTTKERFELFKTAGADVITSLLPVLDDFERAIKELEKSGDSDALKGILLIYNKFIEVLRSKGLKPIEIQVGDNFDTEKQEAITQIPAPDEQLIGKVVDVIETGYSLNDKIIRYAKVVIGQ